MCSGRGDSPSRLPGFPIRTPPDQSSVDSAPGPIAASHVLHRFLVPRHPPCALKNLATDARVHYAVLKQPALKKTEPFPENPTARPTRPVSFLFHTEAVLRKSNRPCRIVNVQ